MSLFLRQFPFDDLIIETQGQHFGKASQVLTDWSASLERQAGASPVQPNPPILLTDVQANGSGVLGGLESAGLYRVSVYREVTTADPVSSSLTIDLAWTHNGKALTRTLSLFAGAPQTVTDTASDVEMMEVDPGTSISYTLTYVSNTPGAARYSVTMAAELVGAVA